MIRNELFRLRPLTRPKQPIVTDKQELSCFSMEPDKAPCVFDRRKGDSPAARARIKIE